MSKKDFSSIPSVAFRRSKFDLGHSLKTSMNVGKLYPIDWQEVLPGDTFSTKVTNVTRITSSFIKPVMDTLKLEIAHFFVPYRLVYEDWERVFGNPNPSAYSDNDLAEIPGIGSLAGEYYVESGSVADYLGLPVGSIPNTVDISVLPFRAFALIYDTWFRNQNNVSEMFVQKGDTGDYEFLNNDAWSPYNYTGKLPNVRKKYDYFTSCLPAPQKGQAINVPAYAGNINLQALPTNDVAGKNVLYIPSDTGFVGFNESLAFGSGFDYGDIAVAFTSGTDSKKYDLGFNVNDLSFANVNDLRFAFQAQKMLERDALGGSRYHEYLSAHFGVYSPDARFQLPEYLGGGIIPINVQQVAQTSESTENSPLANVAGYSLTNGFSKYSKGFTEHGMVFTVAYIRQYEHTYSQGLDKKWFRKQRHDFYDPLFANLGEQPVYKKELFCTGFDLGDNYNDAVFGYNEAWADYRYSPNKITGQMRSGISNSLDIWHFGDRPYNFSNPSQIVISKSFIEETPSYVDDTLSVPSTSQDQFICDFYFDSKAIRVMPLYSVPGLIDHH